MTQNDSCFVLSTGRCGTQWLHHIFTKYYAEEFHVEFEPLANKYNSRVHLNHKDLNAFNMALEPQIRIHLNQIKAHTLNKKYVETGHPNWGILQYLPEFFEGKVKIIFISRDPISIVNSWMSHRMYHDPIVAGLPKKIPITPFDAGVLYPEYKSDWKDFLPEDKILYYWLEINSLGKQLLRNPTVNIIHIRYKDMFTQVGILKILNFLGAEMHQDIKLELNLKIDQYPYFKSNDAVCKRIRNDEKVLLVAKLLDHDIF